MFLVNFVGKIWYGKSEWERRCRGEYFEGERKNIEPYFSHPLEKKAWELRKARFK
jgi:hypothetical protein